jgi:hypothetical protein
MTPPERAAAALSGLVAVAALGACTGAGSSTSVEDEPIVGRSASDVTGDEVFVLLPSGRIDLTIGEPLEEAIDGDVTSDDETHEPPDGGSFVPVAWSHDPFALDEGDAALMSTAPKPSEVAIVVDGERHVLGSPYEVVSDKAVADNPVSVFYVPVEGVPTPSDITVEVEYDGLTQSITAAGERAPGAAAPLYDEPAGSAEAACGPGVEDPAGFAFRLRCEIGPGQAVPYLPDRGWAAEGHAFVVVGYELRLDDVTYSPPGSQGEAEYDVVRTTATFRLDGQDPLGSMPELGDPENEEGRVSDFLVFDSTTDAERSLQIELAYDLSVDDLDGVADAPTSLELSRVADL